MTPKTVAIIGAGDRGTGFAQTIASFSHLGKVTAVAEPRDDYRNALASRHGLTRSMTFSNWADLLAQPRLADAVVLATPDRLHVGPAVAALDAGYDLLLEKPMGVSLEECRAIEAAQRRTGRIVAVCHSLRYQRGFRKVKDLLAAGAIGQIMSIDLVERVEVRHQAHSFVRGNWGNQARSTFMLLAKSCHDIDYLAYIAGQPCTAVSSFAQLSYFRPDHAPAGAPARCTDGCPAEPTCTFSAYRNYVNTDRTRWFASVASHDHSYEAHMEAIRTGQYGRCVYRCDNDVVDHQVVSLQFAGDITAVFTMTAFTQTGGRRLRVYGTHGELDFNEDRIAIETFQDGTRQVIEQSREAGSHGGGDTRIVREWLTALHTRDDRPIVANAQESLRAHTIAFAAEHSRLTGQTVSLAAAPWMNS